jgi:DNA-binding CsgD family transcriptional regulator
MAVTQYRDNTVRQLLVQREKQVLQLLADGYDCRASAKKLKLSYDYIKVLMKRSREVLGADSSTQAVAMAIRRGIIS